MQILHEQVYISDQIFRKGLFGLVGTLTQLNSLDQFGWHKPSILSYYLFVPIMEDLTAHVQVEVL